MIFSELINNKIYSINIDAILKKMKKLNYSISKLYQIITLLNCLKKISEKIIVKQLSYLEQISNIFNFNQIDK